MKKITLLFICAVLSLNLTAQETISFESTEGYTLGDINTQNGWVSTGDGAGGFVTNQVVSDEQASDGSYSLKITTESAFGGQESPIVGGFYDYSTPVSYVDAVFSTDLYIDTFDSSTTSDYMLGFINLTDGVFITYINFSYTGDINILADDGAGTVILDDTLTDWTPLTWFNVRMELTTGGAVEIFIDNVSIYTGTVATPDADIEHVRFVHDNFAGFAYLDNFRTNDEPTASVNEFDSSSLTHYYDKNSETFNLESSNSPITNIEIYSIQGKRVISQPLSNTTESINTASLADGVYLAKVTIDGNSETIKFIKN
ncbi:T9SS type A sorting domain-containing protein [Winogradskyella vidalii]|uniref:T9SS type A sorting domain-containing protein n=1 Tax=Winogradskyella vidalii TaxID=2615024 RepID=UPI0015C6A564|nr:T9SS type A sorting domain-containing protein [Winogradskyella vidalii]